MTDENRIQKVNHAYSYPFALPTNDFVFLKGRSLPIARFDPVKPANTAVINDKEIVSLATVAPEIEQIEFVPVLASGSNAAPDQLARKFKHHLDEAVVIVPSGIANGITAVYSAHFASYGAIPATLTPTPGGKGNSRLFCTFIPIDLLPVMNKSEALGRNYGLYRLAGFDFKVGGESLSYDVMAYVSLHGRLRLDESPVRLTDIEFDEDIFPSAREKEILYKVHQRLAPDKPIDSFIISIIENSDARARYTNILKSKYSEPSGSPLWERIE